ncbi:MAG: MFS transporter [Armatimonadetes bacterium]|nr:MFS transporter [Armatimonadota bacterium]
MRARVSVNHRDVKIAPSTAETARAQSRGWYGLSPAVMRMSVFNFTIFLAWQITLPVAPLLAQSMNAAPLWIGLTIGARGLLPMVLGLPIGWLTDRLPVRTVQVMGGGCVLAATALMAGTNSIIPLIIAQALGGLSVTVASIAGQAFIASVTATRDRDEVYGRYSLIVALDNVAGPALGGLLAQWGGPKAAVVGGLVLAVAALPLALVLPSRRTAAPVLIATPRSQHPLALLGLPTVLFTLFASFLVIFSTSVKSSFYVIYLDRIGLGSGAIGIVLAISGAARTVVRPMLSWATARTGRPRLLVFVCLTLAAGLAMVPVAGSRMTGQVALAVLHGIAYGLSQPLTITMMSHAVSVDNLGLAFAWRQIFSRCGELLGPLTMGWVAGAAGLEPVFWLAAGMLAIVALLPAARRRDGAVPSPGAEEKTAETDPHA